MKAKDKKLLKKLKARIKKGYGPKCSEYAPFCACCIVWRSYNDLKSALDI